MLDAVTNLESLLISDLHEAYRTGRLSPTAVVSQLMDRADQAPERCIWITRLTREHVMTLARSVEVRGMQDQPLYGIPFVIKDNIDLAGVPTTAGCPEFAHVPDRSATVVQRLLDAGAIPLGKTNLDQFATGLVGVRSPHGACRNSFDADMISGGSSAGSAVAVATGLCTFSLGTDTAGSGRVPAAFNNIIGLKPSLGHLSTLGVVPACRSLDCVSIFALTADDAAAVLAAAEGFDEVDVYSKPVRRRALAALRFGVPRAPQLQFFGDTEYADLFEQAAQRLESLGLRKIEVDFAPFLDAAKLLYEGPWVAERYAAVGQFLEANPHAGMRVTRQIIEGGRAASAVSAFQSQYRLMALKRAGEKNWADVDLILTPTAGTVYSIAAVEADPVRLNANLGYYTNFMNLFDLAGVAVPAGFRRDGLPFGVTLVGPSATDRALLELAGRLHRATSTHLGASRVALPAPRAAASTALPGHLPIAVCGAHMSGLPLNHQLRERGGALLESTRTAACYRLFALPGGPPQRPGLVRVVDGGCAIELEVWQLPAEQMGGFLAGIPTPLGIGKVELENGTQTLGFICEGFAATGATDITAHGGWRAYQRAQGLPA